MSPAYDSIGESYSRKRQPEPRITVAINRALAGCSPVLNVGAGTGSYEPPDLQVVAVEPSRTMIAQRPPGSAPVVQACAEALPFRDASFDATLGVLTVHHWRDRSKGLSECARVTRSRLVFFTVDLDVYGRFWLFDYLPEMLGVTRRVYPSIQQFEGTLGPVEITPVPIPADCRDGFLCAYWSRPNEFLDPLVRANISTFSRMGNTDEGLARLRRDIESGEWKRRYARLQDREECDCGYRIVVSRLR